MYHKIWKSKTESIDNQIYQVSGELKSSCSPGPVSAGKKFIWYHLRAPLPSKMLIFQWYVYVFSLQDFSGLFYQSQESYRAVWRVVWAFPSTTPFSATCGLEHVLHEFSEADVDLEPRLQMMLMKSPAVFVCSFPWAGVGAGVSRAEEPSPVSSQSWRGNSHPALSGRDLWWCWVGFHTLFLVWSLIP